MSSVLSWSPPDPCPLSLCLLLPHHAPLQLAYCVVQFLEKDATLTEHVSTSGGKGKPPPLQV